MNESYADAYELTGDSKYLETAKRFSHKRIFDNMAHRTDNLDNMHANTQVPKAVGYQRVAELTGDPAYTTAGEFFWETVTGNRSYLSEATADANISRRPKDAWNTRKSGKARNRATPTTCLNSLRGYSGCSLRGNTPIFTSAHSTTISAPHNIPGMAATSTSHRHAPATTASTHNPTKPCGVA